MTLGQQTSGKDLRGRFLWVAAAMVLGLFILSVQLYRLQVIANEEYVQKSVENFVKEARVRAYRGLIKDSRDAILAENRPSFDLHVTPAFCEQCDEEVLPRIGQLLLWDDETLGYARDMVKAGRRSKFEPVPVRLDLTRDELDVLNAHRLELPGVDIPGVAHRNYRTGSVLSHLLGYMNEVTQDELDAQSAETPLYALGDFIGRRGLERSFEAQLRGVTGLRREVVNARGQPIPELNALIEAPEVPSVPGNNLVLSIDMNLQEEAERVFPGVAGAVVVVNVKTGFIEALISRPGFDPNLLTGRVTSAQMQALTQDPLQPMVFRVSAQHYSPGSTFKVVTALAALKSGQFGPQTAVFCPGGYRLGARTWRCHLDRGHGYQDGRAALQHSCDTYYYKVADVLGLEPIAEMGRALGLGQPTGIKVVAEVPGIMPSVAYHQKRTPGGYTKGMALNAAIGQGDDNVTPLQLAMLYAAIANGGTLYRPQVVRHIESTDGRKVQTFEPEVVRQVDLDPEHRRLVVDALAAVVNEPGGTAYRSRLPDIRIAGKTGTAQVAKLGKVRLKTAQMDYWARDHAWFAAFAPAEAPEIAVVVLNEHGGHGGSDAAPTAQAVIRKYFDLKNGVLREPSPVSGEAPALPTGVVGTVSHGPAH
ncbi:MAG: penicillin-binding protein 2 [Myxococcaceae bacterium]